jgi:hypothetical protein
MAVMKNIADAKYEIEILEAPEIEIAPTQHDTQDDER